MNKIDLLLNEVKRNKDKIKNTIMFELNSNRLQLSDQSCAEISILFKDKKKIGDTSLLLRLDVDRKVLNYQITDISFDDTLLAMMMLDTKYDIVASNSEDFGTELSSLERKAIDKMFDQKIDNLISDYDMVSSIYNSIVEISNIEEMNNELLITQNPNQFPQFKEKILELTVKLCEQINFDEYLKENRKDIFQNAVLDMFSSKINSNNIVSYLNKITAKYKFDYYEIATKLYESIWPLINKNDIDELFERLSESPELFIEFLLENNLMKMKFKKVGKFRI